MEPFLRDDIIAVMDLLKISPATLTGAKRKAHRGNFLPSETLLTFKSLSDRIDYFAAAMKIELEHGRAAGKINADVTADNIIDTARIAKAHIYGIEYGSSKSEPFPSYYDYLI